MPSQDRKQPNESDMQAAIKDVTEKGASVAEAARKWGLKSQTVSARLKGRGTILEGNRRKQLLTKEQEDLLAVWCVEQGQAGDPPTSAALLEFANSLLRRRGNDRPLSKKWLLGFKARNPAVMSVNARSMPVVSREPSLKARRFPEQSSRSKYCTRDAELAFTMGETGIGVSEVQAFENRWNTIVECVSASGHVLPPLAVFKGKKDSIPELPPLFEQWVVTCQEKAWVTDDLAVRWVQEVFDPATRQIAETLGERRLLIMTGHGIHNSLAFLRELWLRDIDLAILPTQPLVSLFGSLKNRYTTLMDYKGFGIESSSHASPRAFLEIYAKARAVTLTKEAAQTSFRSANDLEVLEANDQPVVDVDGDSLDGAVDSGPSESDSVSSPTSSLADTSPDTSPDTSIDTSIGISTTLDFPGSGPVPPNLQKAWKNLKSSSDKDQRDLAEFLENILTRDLPSHISGVQQQ